MKHLATITNGKVAFDNPAQWAVDCAKMEGKRVEVDLHLYFPCRSDAQNRYYQGIVIPILMTYTGYSKDEMHEIIKQKFFSREITIKGEKFLLTSTKTATTQEWEEKMSRIREWASLEIGAYIPLPNESSSVL